MQPVRHEVGNDNTDTAFVPKSPLLTTEPKTNTEGDTGKQLRSMYQSDKSVDSRGVSRIDSTAHGEPTQSLPPNNRKTLGVFVPITDPNKSLEGSERIIESIEPYSNDQIVFSEKQKKPTFFGTLRFFGKRRSMSSTKVSTIRYGKDGIEGLPVQESKQKGAQNLVLNDLRVVENKPKPSLCVASIAFLVVFLAVVSPLIYFLTNSSESSEEDFSSCGSTERDDELRNLVTAKAVINDNTLTFGALIIDCLPPSALSNVDGIENVERIDLSQKGLTKVCSNSFSGTDLTNVDEFIMDKNGLQELPNGVFATMTEVSAIDLSYNAFQTLNNPVFEGLEKLDRLLLNDNSGLVSFPEAINSALSITNLQLIDSPSISYATDNLFSDFTSLTIVLSPGTAILTDDTETALEALGQKLGGVTISFPV